MGLEIPIAFAQQHTYRVSDQVGDCGIEFAVTIEISEDQAVRASAGGGIDMSFESTVTLAQKNAYCAVIAVVIVHSYQVQFAVVIDVGSLDDRGRNPGQIIHMRL